MSKYFDGKLLSGYEESPINYVYGGNLEECHKVIADLEAKLAESESRFQAHKQNDARIIQDQTDLIENLKQQVKEKEKQLAEYSDINNALNSGLKDRCISCEEEHNQDKISFAVEQLEKVKEKLDQDDKYVWAVADLPMDYCKGHERSYVGTISFINNQIKQLKEKKGE